MGDVPKETGVCTDVVVRAYRGVGIDLQLVREDIVAHPDAIQTSNRHQHRPSSS